LVRGLKGAFHPQDLYLLFIQFSPFAVHYSPWRLVEIDWIAEVSGVNWGNELTDNPIVVLWPL
jgi:hypothetical protein